MRLFIAVNFYDRVIDQIVDIQERLRARSLRGNFTRRENLHLTLAFLGETPAEKVDDLRQIIETIRAVPFEILFTRTGCFTHSRKELWWIGAESNSPGIPLITSIHRELLERLLAAGFSVDTRPFSAHITLGREIKHSAPIILNPPNIAVRVDRISLMKSENIRGKLTYTELFGTEMENPH